MSKQLATLLHEPEQNLAEMVLALEKLSGHPAADVKLQLEINKVAAEQMRRMGLDVDDTTGEELYHALMSRFEYDDNRFARLIGGSSRHEHDELVPLVCSRLASRNGLGQTYGLKRTVAKSLLRDCPPKSLMKHLRYRTLDSLLKRESPAEVLAAAPYTEGKRWGEKFMSKLARLQPSDFETQNTELVIMPTDRWGNLPRRGSIVGYIGYLGAVVIWPNIGGQPSALALATLIIQAANSQKALAAWLKFNQVSPNFGQILADTAAGLEPTPLSAGGQPISWRSMLAHYGRDKVKLPSILDEYLDGGDVIRPVEVELCKLEGSLSWWLGLDFVGIVKDRVISFNISDVAINFANHLSYQSAVTDWLQLSLRDQLVSTYLSNSWVEDSLMGQLEED